mgnify:CR=1 FL=1
MAQARRQHVEQFALFAVALEALQVLQQPAVVERTGTDGLGMTVETIDYDKLDQPAVVRRRSPSVGGAAAGAAATDPSAVQVEQCKPAITLSAMKC